MRNWLARIVCVALSTMGSAVSASAQTPVIEGETIGPPELVQAACAEGQVIYYTAQSDGDERVISKSFEQAFPCLKISVISAVTGRLFERIATEAQAGTPQGDLTIITDEALAQVLIDRKLARSWNPPAAPHYPENAKVESWWYAASGSLMYPIYNTQLVTGSDIPKTWNDLLAPAWKGKIATSPITIGGTAWMQYGFLRATFGDDYLRKLAAQEPKLFSAYNPAVLSVARGETLVGIVSALNDYPVRVGQGAPIEPIYPSEGIPFTNYPMLLLANSPHPHAAELFANWYLSRSGQTQLVKVRGAYSLRQDVPPAKGNPPLGDLRLWNPGHDAILRDHDALVTEVNAIFGRH